MNSCSIRLLIAMVGLSAVLSLGACRQVDTAGLTWSSQDKYEYVSTPALPVTLTLVEIYSDEPLWTYDVPVNHTMVLDLDRKGEVELLGISGAPATRMRWRLYQPGRLRRLESGRIELNEMPVMIKVSYRPAPEYPAKHPANSPTASSKPAVPAATAPAATAPASAPASQLLAP